jgi:nucleoside-diphosphate-sugar epimerase
MAGVASSDPTGRRLFCFGLGYTALALADALAAEGWSIAGTCREAEKRAVLAERAIDAHLFSREHPLADADAALAGADHLLLSIPPDERGDPVLDRHADAILRMKRLRWVGYLSTTGVYGNRDGGTVDETSALAPTGDRGRRRVAAEEAWLALWREHRLPLHRFRLAGIYGPGRSAIDQLRAGAAKRVVRPGQVFSRIHVADIVAVLRASMARPDPGAVYNLADDDPAAPAEVVSFAADLLGVAPPPEVPFEQAALSPMARSFWDDNKRVSNARIKRELGVRLRYPSYRDGLQAILAADG